MKLDSFTRDWQPSHRKIYLFLSLLFIGITAVYFFAIVRGHENALEWFVTSTLETIEVPLRQFNVGLFEFDIPVDNYLISQAYQGSAHKITQLSGYLHLTVFSLMLLILITISTYFSRIWYLVSMTATSFVLRSNARIWRP